jgi:NAD(P)-dependent dehydrogenase (short-subunit alcohol dehydrogenase family)
MRDRIAIVTGGASGIGRALCLELGRRGAQVTVTDIDAEAAKAVAGQIAANGGKAAGRRLDVTDAAEVKRLIDEVAAREGRIDLLFNNAGIGIGGEAQYLSLEDWRRLLEVNLFGVIHGVHAAYPLMVAQRSGHIVNTASIAGLFPFPIALPYTASKHAVLGFSLGLRAEAAALGVKVSVVCPGGIDTKIWQRSVLRGQDKERAMAHLRPMMSADRCARAILRGVARNRGTILVTNEARFLASLTRLSPALAGLFARTLVWRYRRIGKTSA